MFKCTECGAIIRVPTAVKTVSCRRCGDVNLVTDGQLRRMYPALHMLPVDAPRPTESVPPHWYMQPEYPLSKWMLPWTRPVKPGNYHVRFRHLEPGVFVARWDGVCFRAPDGQRVRMRDFLTWRGLLA